MLDGTSINMGNMGLKRTKVGLNKSLVMHTHTLCNDTSIDAREVHT